MYLYPIDTGMRDARNGAQQLCFDVALYTDLLSLRYHFGLCVRHIARLLLGGADAWLLKT